MKINIELQKNENPDQADELLEKALKKKKECSGHEAYEDPAMNEALKFIEDKHEELLKSVLKAIEEEIEREKHASW